MLTRGNDDDDVMARAAQGAMLLVRTSKDAKFGLPFLDMSRAVAEIKEVL